MCVLKEAPSDLRNYTQCTIGEKNLSEFSGRFFP
jgi:hypothetical protein